MDYIANSRFNNLHLSRNPIVVIVDPAILAPLAPRVDLRYYLTVKLQSGFQSSVFKDLPTQEASEKPIPSNSTTSPGAFFEIQTRLHDELACTPPTYKERGFSVCPDMTRQFYYVTERWNDDVQLDTAQGPTAWVIRAGISMRTYSMYKDVFFDKHIGENGLGKFLTWQPDFKQVRPDQPERLYFLTNFAPSPTQLMLRVRVLYDDYTFDTYTASQIANITPMTVYSVAVGPAELNFASLPKKVVSYKVWLSNENTKQVSEDRNYKMDYAYYDSVRYVLFQNGLGGYDTIRCVGDSTEGVSVSRQTLERFTDYDYLPTSSDVLTNSVTGERTLTVNIGNWLNDDYRKYLEDALLSEEFYVVDAEEFIPLTPTFNAFATQSANEYPIERTLSFNYSNALGSYSDLPNFTPPERPTGWRQYTVSCELNANGVRTGRQLVNELVKYYLDSGELVRPIVTKANIVGSEGYIEPWLTESCAALETPYLNTFASKTSTFKRSNCSVGNVGGPWTITVPANSYGSEVSQADADAKALTALNALDTQANADLNGTCVPAVNLKIALQNLTSGLTINGQNGSNYYAVPSVKVLNEEIIPNTAGTTVVRYADVTYPQGVYNIDVQVIFASTPTMPYKITIPSKSLNSGTLNGNRTYRFANVPINWGDADVIVKVENA